MKEESFDVDDVGLDLTRDPGLTVGQRSWSLLLLSVPVLLLQDIADAVAVGLRAFPALMLEAGRAVVIVEGRLRLLLLLPVLELLVSTTSGGGARAEVMVPGARRLLASLHRMMRDTQATREGSLPLQLSVPLLLALP